MNLILQKPIIQKPITFHVMCDPDPNTPNIQITFPNDTLSAIVLSANVMSATSRPDSFVASPVRLI